MYLYSILFFILSLTISQTCTAAADSSKPSYSFAVVPQQLTSTLFKKWNPLLIHLSEQTGVELSFATAKNISAFEKNLLKQSYDFAYMNPFHYVTYHKTSDYHAYAKEKDKQINGILVTKKDSSITDLNSLSAQTLAFPSPKAFAATLLTQSDLKKQNIKFNAKYTGSHDTVYFHIAHGHYLAGGGVIRTLNALNKNIRSQLRVLHTTKGHTPHAFASHSRVPQHIVQKIKLALTKLYTSDKGKQLLKNLGLKEVEPASDENWNDIRKLNLN